MKTISVTIVLLVNFFEKIILHSDATSAVPVNLDLCGPNEDIILGKKDASSAAIVNLMPPESKDMKICKLRVTAHKNYAINVQFIETSVEIYKALLYNNSEHHPPCLMSVYLPDNLISPFWRGDLCSVDPLPEIDLLTPDFKIVWTPPAESICTKGRKIILTAVGSGLVCAEPGQHTCMRVGRLPAYCVSEDLRCDGYQNCPKISSSSDEDPKLCKHKKKLQNPWIELTEKFLQLKGKIDENNSSTPKVSYGDWKEWKDVRKRKTTPKPVIESKKPDTISTVLSKYGPWGYLMLGMLICGTVLMFCGLWECCLRKPKTTVETPPQTPPTTVLIINAQEETPNPPPMPPNYDELDLPPSYTTLFPNLKNSRSTPQLLNVTNLNAVDLFPHNPNRDNSEPSDTQDDSVVIHSETSSEYCSFSENNNVNSSSDVEEDENSNRNIESCSQRT